MIFALETYLEDCLFFVNSYFVLPYAPTTNLPKKRHQSTSATTLFETLTSGPLGRSPRRSDCKKCEWIWPPWKKKLHGNSSKSWNWRLRCVRFYRFPKEWACILLVNEQFAGWKIHHFGWYLPGKMGIFMGELLVFREGRVLGCGFFFFQKMDSSEKFWNFEGYLGWEFVFFFLFSRDLGCFIFTWMLSFFWGGIIQLNVTEFVRECWKTGSETIVEILRGAAKSHHVSSCHPWSLSPMLVIVVSVDFFGAAWISGLNSTAPNHLIKCRVNQQPWHPWIVRRMVRHGWKLNAFPTERNFEHIALAIAPRSWGFCVICVSFNRAVSCEGKWMKSTQKIFGMCPIFEKKTFFAMFHERRLFFMNFFGWHDSSLCRPSRWYKAFQ